MGPVVQTCVSKPALTTLLGLLLLRSVLSSRPKGLPQAVVAVSAAVVAELEALQQLAAKDRAWCRLELHLHLRRRRCLVELQRFLLPTVVRRPVS